MPAKNRIHSEFRRVMVDAKAHPAGIGCHVMSWGAGGTDWWSGIKAVRRALGKPQNPDRLVDSDGAVHTCERHPRLGCLQKGFGVRIRHDPSVRRLLPSCARADLAADTNQLSVPRELDD